MPRYLSDLSSKRDVFLDEYLSKLRNGVKNVDLTSISVAVYLTECRKYFDCIL